MLRDEQEITPEIAQQVIERLKGLLKRTDKSASSAARSLGLSPSTLSELMNGSYAANSEKHYRAIDKWIETQIMKENAPRPIGFVKSLEVSRQIYAAFRWAVETNSIVLVHGPAGIGKTITAKAIRAETPGSIFVSVTTAGIRKTAIMLLIAEAMGIPLFKTTADELFKQLVSALAGTGRPLIVDEIHKLEGRQKDEALHCLRDLHDATEIPMMFLGMSSIAQYIQQGKAKGHESLDQLHSRVGYWLSLTDAADSGNPDGGLYSMQDIQKIITAGKLRMTPDATRYLHLLANLPGQGALRSIDKLLKLASKHAEKTGEVIGTNLLRSIQASRLGIRVASEIDRHLEMRTANVA